jgi:signal transduction histidine kinase/ActR/RegA family two-component response regulator
VSAPRRLTIRWRLTQATVAASGIALALVTLVFMVYETRRFEEVLVQRISAEGEIVALNAASALLFRDPEAAAGTLAGLSAEDSVRAAAIYDADGRLFAQFRRSAQAPEPSPVLPAEFAEPRHASTSDALVLSRPITFQGSRLGTVLIRADTAEQGARLRSYTGLAAAVSLGAFAVAVLLAASMHRSLSRPISSLAQTARLVAEKKDYSARAMGAGPGELGLLVATFNGMLDNLQKRDEALQETRRRLESTLEERTALYREAEEANRIKDEFLATLSHELRTPMNAIVGWTSLMASGGLDPETTARAVASIDRNAKAQVRLIEDILDVSSIVSGKLRLKIQPVDLPSVVEAAVDSVRHAAEAKGVALQVALDPEARTIHGDGDRLQQVVWNLVSNAIKFTPPGGRVDVQLTRADARVALQVRDSGQGIKPEFLPHVFERFRQADSSSTRAHGGLGLGLAIVRHLVEMHGGTVEATSEGQGRGATFIVHLPIRPVRAAEEPGTGAPLSRLAATTRADDLTGVRVLVVEDDAESRALLESMLARLGAEVEVAASAAEAMAALERRAPDVLLSDIEMPGEDGYSLIRRIRALPSPEGSRLPAAALTAYARTEDRIAALSAGFQFHLAKPVGAGELAAVVASLARRRTSGSPSGPPDATG